VKTAVLALGGNALARPDEPATIASQFQHARALAFPGGQQQERVVNGAYVLNRYGMALPSRLIGALPLEAGNHFVLTL